MIARLIDSHPDFEPRAWLSELSEMDAFGALIFQVIGQQLSLAATRSILGISSSSSAADRRHPRGFSKPTPKTSAAQGCHDARCRLCTR